MISLNKVVLIGQVKGECEILYTASGLAISKFRLATSELVKNKEAGVKKEVLYYHNITCFGDLAEVVKEFSSDGVLLMVDGKTQNKSYEDKAGNKKYFNEIIARDVKFLDSDKVLSGNSSQGSSPKFEDEIPF